MTENPISPACVAKPARTSFLGGKFRAAWNHLHSLMSKTPLAAKLAGSFGSLVMILAILGLVGWSNLTYIGQKVENAEKAERLIDLSATGQLTEKDYMLRPDTAHLGTADSLAADAFTFSGSDATA